MNEENDRLERNVIAMIWAIVLIIGATTLGVLVLIITVISKIL